MASIHFAPRVTPGASAFEQRRAPLQCMASSSSNQSNSSQGGRNDKSRPRHRTARVPGLFEVKVIAPPPKSLGIYALPPLTHCGEEIEVDGQGFVVTSVSIQMRLNKGKYVRHHSRLDVTPTGRFFLEKTLEHLLHAKYVGPTGLQD